MIKTMKFAKIPNYRNWHPDFDYCRNAIIFVPDLIRTNERAFHND